jgi:DNA-binding PadR family transcriptional regulator
MTAMERPLITDPAGTGDSIPVSRLCAELDDESRTNDPAVSDVVAEVESALLDADSFTFQKDHFKSSLDELLLALVALRSSDTHGKQLLDDLEAELDADLSPGTVYPRLHGLCDEDLLERRELVRTKEYTLADGSAAHERVSEAARQHLALGLFLRTAADRADFE